mmetsp:Transcript_34725/g.82364  ORF Transcript_34725/g.82364 Transcript_34725/m.82364 type:complete len:247 (+) Transcript_34725:1795-2535(+)
MSPLRPEQRKPPFHKPIWDSGIRNGHLEERGSDIRLGASSEPRCSLLVCCRARANPRGSKTPRRGAVTGAHWIEQLPDSRQHLVVGRSQPGVRARAVDAVAVSPKAPQAGQPHPPRRADLLRGGDHGLRGRGPPAAPDCAEDRARPRACRLGVRRGWAYGEACHLLEAHQPRRRKGVRHLPQPPGLPRHGGWPFFSFVAGLLAVCPVTGGLAGAELARDRERAGALGTARQTSGAAVPAGGLLQGV